MGQKDKVKMREKAVSEYLSGKRSYRELERMYGIPSSTLQRLVAATGIKKETWGSGVGGSVGEQLREAREAELEVKRLRGELEAERLHNRVLNAMIDIAEEQFEIPIRKKRGAKR